MNMGGYGLIPYFKRYVRGPCKMTEEMQTESGYFPLQSTTSVNLFGRDTARGPVVTPASTGGAKSHFPILDPTQILDTHFSEEMVPFQDRDNPTKMTLFSAPSHCATTQPGFHNLDLATLMSHPCFPLNKIRAQWFDGVALPKQHWLSRQEPKCYWNISTRAC